ncbi:unnamed protein product [Linum trigynum]|uniref:Uncharacterized protein n=1 Tax=Linum trigynum TaxID=586398 RepID=A0AAV2GKP1_9ROSI
MNLAIAALPISSLNSTRLATSCGVSTVAPQSSSSASPSVPPLVDAVIEEGPIHYLRIDVDAVDMSSEPPTVESPVKACARKEGRGIFCVCDMFGRSC